jgi:molybdopterin-guanine dinucleotide biosynthesis protein A
MSYRLQQVVDESIVCIQLNSDFDLMGEFNNLTDAVSSVLREQRRKCILIVDVDSPSLNVEAFLNAAAQAGSALWNHPKIDYHLLVSYRKDAELEAQGLSSIEFQNHEIPVFSTRSEAFCYVRQVP